MPWYRSGTVNVTNNSTSVVGNGTNWTQAVEVGEAFYGPDSKVYEIANVVSDTQLTLATPYQGGTAAGQSYVIIPSQSYIRELAAEAAALVANYGATMSTAGAGRFADGTVTAPGIRFTADDDTGVRRTGSNALALVAGFKQSLPDAAATLIDIPANTSGERITKTDMVTLDAVEPNWRKRSSTTVIRHFMHDPRTPRIFHVYPPASNGASVDIEYSQYPTDVPVPSGASYTSVSGDISLRPQWSTALLSMVLHYAYAKDAEFGGNAALSAAYLQRAQAILGVELQSSAVIAPTS